MIRLTIKAHSPEALIISSNTINASSRRFDFESLTVSKDGFFVAQYTTRCKYDIEITAKIVEHAIETKIGTDAEGHMYRLQLNGMITRDRDDGDYDLIDPAWTKSTMDARAAVDKCMQIMQSIKKQIAEKYTEGSDNHV